MLLCCCFPVPVQSYQPVSPGQPGWICSQNEEPEPFEDIQQDQSQRLGVQHPFIKPEKPEHSVDAYRESVDLPSEASNTEGSHMCADHTDIHPIVDDMTNCHFPSKIKVEFMNSSLCSGDAMGSTEDAYQSCNEQPDISSPNEKFRNHRQAEGAILQFKRSPKNEVGNSPNPSTGQDSTDYKNEGVTLPKCVIDKERAMTPTSDSSSIGPYPEFDVLRNDDPCDDFSPPQNVQTVCNDTPKSSVKAQTYGTVKKRKRRSRVHNQVNTIFKITHSELCT